MISTSLVTTHWNEFASGYDPIMSSDPAYRDLLTRIVERIPENAQNILDLGCGTGALTKLCHLVHPQARIVGLDPALKMLEEARIRIQTSKVSFQEGSAADLSMFPSHSFDAVVSNFALHHLSHDDKKVCAREVFRVLRPGGWFIYGDQHCSVMGEVDDPERVLHTLDLLTNKARHYFLNAGMERMLLQLRLLPRFINQDGEILATPEFWVEAFQAAAFAEIETDVIRPAELMNRVISGQHPLTQ
ncbi:MAG TPA: class I SAM-dependent methyltransferase [Candidatus Angelobacter sp.]|jgi:ubiquinone/menaquinone biosynthesis C-methylase UbiE|nr:class I SAM-dependent methyltransferase [Candidatus Angelobacter sp.]